MNRPKSLPRIPNTIKTPNKKGSNYAKRNEDAKEPEER
jgi:hypothetical protein